MYFLKKRRLSVQEAAYRLSNLHLVHSTRTVRYLNTRPERKHYKILKPKAERDALPEDSTDIFHTNIIDYYHARPTLLKHVTLYEFAEWYVTSEKQSKDNEDKCLSLLPHFPDKCVCKRNTFFVIRTPKFTLASDDYYYNLLLLFIPHQCENELLKGSSGQIYQSAKDAFYNKQHAVDISAITSFPLHDELENAVRYICLSSAELGEILMPSTIETGPLEPNQNDPAVPSISYNHDRIHQLPLLLMTKTALVIHKGLMTCRLHQLVMALMTVTCKIYRVAVNLKLNL